MPPPRRLVDVRIISDCFVAKANAENGSTVTEEIDMSRILRAVTCIGLICTISIGLGACSNERTPDAGTPVQEAQASDSSQEAESTSIAQSLIGVWQSADGSSTFAYTGSECYSSSTGIVTPYEVEGSKVTLTNFGRSYTVTSIDENALTTDNTQGASHRLDEDPDTFIAEHYVALKPGEEWANETVSIKLQQFAYCGDGGYHTTNGSTYPTIVNEYGAECLVANLGNATIFDEAKFLVNGSTWTNASTLAAPSIEPLQSESPVFLFKPADGVASSVASIQALVRYHVIDQNGQASYVTPWIVLEQN